MGLEGGEGEEGAGGALLSPSIDVPAPVHWTEVHEVGRAEILLGVVGRLAQRLVIVLPGYWVRLERFVSIFSLDLLRI